MNILVFIVVWGCMVHWMILFVMILISSHFVVNIVNFMGEIMVAMSVMVVFMINYAALNDIMTMHFVSIIVFFSNMWVNWMMRIMMLVRNIVKEWAVVLVVVVMMTNMMIIMEVSMVIVVVFIMMYICMVYICMMINMMVVVVTIVRTRFVVSMVIS